MNPVDKFQEAFSGCLAVPAEDSRPSAEQNISKFIEAARRLEVFFLQKQLILSESGDSDDIGVLRTKLKSRDELIARYQQKLHEWKKILE